MNPEIMKIEQEISNSIIEIAHNLEGVIFGGIVLYYLGAEKTYNDIDIGITKSNIKPFIKILGAKYGADNMTIELSTTEEYTNEKIHKQLELFHYKISIMNNINILEGNKYKHETKIDLVNIETVKNYNDFDYDVNSLILYHDGIHVKYNKSEMRFNPSVILYILNNIKQKKFSPIIPFEDYYKLPSHKIAKLILRAQKLIDKGWECTQKIPCKIYKGEEIYTSERINEICAICQEDMLGGDNIIRTICKHDYHANCILEWVISNKYADDCKCPICNCVGDNENRLFISGI
jgi:hypothetical protein